MLKKNYRAKRKRETRLLILALIAGVVILPFAILAAYIKRDYQFVFGGEYLIPFVFVLAMWVLIRIYNTLQYLTGSFKYFRPWKKPVQQPKKDNELLNMATDFWNEQEQNIQNSQKYQTVDVKGVGTYKVHKGEALPNE